ncbi:MAG: AAA family ATPase [Pseudomonadota bacterium]
MAKAEQIKGLISSHLKKDEERFVTIALQLAASEAKRGHAVLADDIRKLVDSRSQRSFKLVSINPELSDLLIEQEPVANHSSLVVTDRLEEKLARIIAEYRQAPKLEQFGMTNRRKVLLAGPPGTGKTMTASALARRAKLPFFVVQIDRLFTRYLGETNAKLRQVFAVIRERPAVYLFDEFDTLGSARGSENDVGEMRRVLNALLQFIEEDRSQGLIVAATNTAKSLDPALFRRFDDILHYGHPDRSAIEALLQNRLSTFRGRFKLAPVIGVATGLSHAEITEACNDAIKEAILADRSTVTQKSLVAALRDRKGAYVSGD